MGQRSAMGYVYFVRCRLSKRIKIGYAVDPDKRVATLQTGSPRPLTKMALMRGTLEYERRLHRRFARHRIRGEWFHEHPELMAFICDHAIRWDEAMFGDRLPEMIARERCRYQELRRRATRMVRRAFARAAAGRKPPGPGVDERQCRKFGIDPKAIDARKQLGAALKRSEREDRMRRLVPVTHPSHPDYRPA